ncbi:hypothetical protein HMI54_006602 [Coelomomyces lativittatus]|nr:hypothetical protein HMI54_006602 [Coelomomyces lativittatus]
MKQRFLNTADLVAHNIKQVFYMKPPPLRRRTELYSFNNPSTVNSIISGSDKELGGSSECSVDWVQDKNANNHHLLFKGNLSFDLPPGALNPASGYCGFRTKKLIGTFFGSLKHDLSLISLISNSSKLISSGLTAAKCVTSKWKGPGCFKMDTPMVFILSAGSSACTSVTAPACVKINLLNGIFQRIVNP